jgi:hypothetical protein
VHEIYQSFFSVESIMYRSAVRITQREFTRLAVKIPTEGIGERYGTTTGNAIARDLA